MAYGNYNVVFLAVMTPLGYDVNVNFDVHDTWDSYDRRRGRWQLLFGRMSFIGVLSLSYQLNLTNFLKNFFCTLNSFSAATLRGGNSCPWGLLIIVCNFDFWVLW